MVVDDNALLREALGEMLQMEGWHVTLCPDGPTALQNVGQRAFDVILVDFRLPAIRGHVVAESLRKFVPHACIIGISVDDRREDFLRSGANGFLLKPFRTTDLAKMVEELGVKSPSTPSGHTYPNG